MKDVYSRQLSGWGLLVTLKQQLDLYGLLSAFTHTTRVTDPRDYLFTTTAF